MVAGGKVVETLRVWEGSAGDVWEFWGMGAINTPVAFLKTGMPNSVYTVLREMKLHFLHLEEVRKTMDLVDREFSHLKKLNVPS